jgi:hypothetical protein
VNVNYAFDRFLRYDEMTAWLHETAAAHPELMTVESYGRSYEGRDLWVATITDTSTGAHDTKPAHWVDANIHAIEVTGGVAALHLIHHLVSGFGTDAHRHRGAAHAHVLRGAAREPRRCRVGAGRQPAVPPQQRSPVAVARRPSGARLHERDLDGDGASARCASSTPRRLDAGRRPTRA